MAMCVFGYLSLRNVHDGRDEMTEKEKRDGERGLILRVADTVGTLAAGMIVVNRKGLL